ncbi:hypothetical protein EGY25_08920 [Brevundimonas intermedia]|uniref:Uncharacterized protein n=1 Tax=Brevundimonas intermedia TaxID=74315 RepID=A0A4Y9RVA3_9CAUL|nr:hypothetical protein [Brevundimonas intermedia]TFW12161.1 hypothetical protein EGY25_08920 [Brevundimonas intermedia]
MNSNTARIGLAAVAAFYVIVTSLFLQAYIPLQRFYASVEATSLSIDPNSRDQRLQDTLSYPENERKVSRYGSILLWGTVGIATFGGVYVATRQRKRVDRAQSAKGITK